MQYKGVFKVDIKVVVCVLPTSPSPKKLQATRSPEQERIKIAEGPNLSSKHGDDVSGTFLEE